MILERSFEVRIAGTSADAGIRISRTIGDVRCWIEIDVYVYRLVSSGTNGYGRDADALLLGDYAPAAGEASFGPAVARVFGCCWLRRAYMARDTAIHRNPAMMHTWEP